MFKFLPNPKDKQNQTLFKGLVATKNPFIIAPLITKIFPPSFHHGQAKYRHSATV